MYKDHHPRDDLAGVVLHDFFCCAIFGITSGSRACTYEFCGTAYRNSQRYGDRNAKRHCNSG